MDNISQFIQHVCTKYPEKKLFDDITYGESYSFIKQRAAFLQTLGVKKGSVVAILAVNTPEWCITHVAICITGATVLSLDGNLPMLIHQQMMERVGVKYVFISEKFATKFKKIKSLGIALTDNVIDEKNF